MLLFKPRKSELSALRTLEMVVDVPVGLLESVTCHTWGSALWLGPVV